MIAIYSFSCIGFIQFGVWVYAIISTDPTGMSGRFSTREIDPHRVPITGTDNRLHHRKQCCIGRGEG
jgi:hypothetical protein